MFLKSDGLKKTDSKCDLMDEKRDSIEVDNLDLPLPPKRHRKWHILNIIVNATIIALTIGIVIYEHHEVTNTFTGIKIEDKIFEMTMTVANETEAVLQEVLQQANHMNRKNREIAHRYVVKIWDAIKERRDVGVEKADRIIRENIDKIKNEIQDIETITTQKSKILVDTLQNSIDEARKLITSANDRNLTQILEYAILQTEYNVRNTWNELDQLYSHYTWYSSEEIGNKVQNMTNRITNLLGAQRKYCDCIPYERVSICYNISLANIETSKTIKKIVQVIDNLYNATNTIENLQSIHPDGDEHLKLVFEESKSLLTKCERNSQNLLNSLLHDSSYILGSELRIQAEHLYPQIKIFILRKWKSSIENAATEFNATVSGHLLIKNEDQKWIVNDVQDNLRKFGDEIKAKATLITDKTVQGELIDKAEFNKLKILMKNRYKNATEEINSLYTSGLNCTAEALKYDVESIIETQLPYISILTIQNYLPTDVCPLAMEFEDFATRVLYDATNRGGTDELDRLLSTNGYTYSGDDTTQVTEIEPTTKFTKIKFLNDLDLKNVIIL